jgi:hypothetical protein
MPKNTDTSAHERHRSPGKGVRVLAREPERLVLDADVRAVSSQEIGLVLDEPLAEGSVVAVLDRHASLGDSRILTARVAHAAPLNLRAWLVRCRFASPLAERELQALLN